MEGKIIGNAGFFAEKQFARYSLFDLWRVSEKCVWIRREEEVHLMD